MTRIDTRNMTSTQRQQMTHVLEHIEKLNRSVKQAVESGLTIEISRAARHHCGGGNWGDVMSTQVSAKG
jgi:hypothetical protein